jgi:hypothetical protein
MDAKYLTPEVRAQEAGAMWQLIMQQRQWEQKLQALFFLHRGKIHLLV